MEWWGYLSVMGMGLVILLAMGMPVAFAFLLVNILCVIFFMGGLGSLGFLILSMYDSLATFVYAPIPLFILMGEIMFRSRMAYRAMDVIENILGKMPGRLSIISVISGTLFASLTGSAMANVAMLGSTLTPEMQARGYKSSMSIGPILGSSGLAIMIPPSSLGVILGSLAFIPIADILIGGIVPGLLMALGFLIYIVIRCILNPSLAPIYEKPPVSLSKKIEGTVKYILPLGLIIFSVIGLILLGIATPSESAAMGALTTAVLAGAYGSLNKEVIYRSIMGTCRISIMVLIIIAGAQAFSQLLSFTGAARGLVSAVLSQQMPPLLVVVAMMAVLLILGCFMEQVCMMMVTIPLFMPMVQALGFNPLWFGILMLITLDVAGITPPFGLNLFVMKGVAPEGTSMADIYRAGFPFIAIIIAVLVLLLLVPTIALWLPGLMVRG
jgi:tripartite ATP-independent transporter DctM subunit